MATNPPVSELQTRAEQWCLELGVNYPMFVKQIQQESGWRQYGADGNVLTSYSGVAKGIGQLHQSYYPEDIWSDPWKNLKQAIQTMGSNYRKFGTWRKALAAYNWGPGNVGGYTDQSGRVHPAWDGTRDWQCPQRAVVGSCATTQRNHYLDAILGSMWAEPAVWPTLTQPSPMPPTPTPSGGTVDQFSVGSGMRNKMLEYADSPASDELYFKDPAGENQYSVAYGQTGAQYVYIFALNRVFRFPAD